MKLNLLYYHKKILNPYNVLKSFLAFEDFNMVFILENYIIYREKSVTVRKIRYFFI